MEFIKIGLDFGTHQTKICVQTIPDEGHGQPNYEFFKFTDLNGIQQYFLPSIIQINKDNTLSYGYVDETNKKECLPKPILDTSNTESSNTDIEELSSTLYKKYATPWNKEYEIAYIKIMLNIRGKVLHEKERMIAQKKYEEQLKEYNKKNTVFKYFKQATFFQSNWQGSINQRNLSIWYLSYILFLLEEKYQNNFSINMGIPADDKSFERKKRNAVEILLSAYNLVENVFENNKEKFLSSTIEELLQKTEIKQYSKELKDEYIINIFPEAYAGLICLSSRGKLSRGMSLTADIGGGTTDISFFTLQENKPTIYKYWSIPKGLNYIAEQSGFDYSQDSFNELVDQKTIEDFNEAKFNIVKDLVRDLIYYFKLHTNVHVKNLNNALNNRILVYNGGGSTYNFLTCAMNPFTDVNIIDPAMWKEENVKEKDKISQLCQLLSTAYGLSVCENDNEVKLCDFTNLFSHLEVDDEKDMEDLYIDKDMC